MKILLVLDSKNKAMHHLPGVLEAKNYQLLQVNSGHKALNEFTISQPDIVLLDSELSDISGNDLCLEIRMLPEGREIPIILMSNDTSEDAITTALASGADEFCFKPIRENELLSKIFFLLRRHSSTAFLEDVTSISKDLKYPEAFANIISVAPEMLAIFRYCEGIAASRQPVLITGETGVGKEIMARTLYSLYGQGKFWGVNLAGIDDSVFSDTLFDHVKGAFTGASSDRQGLVERASGGVLFLDEVGDLNHDIQVKLLRLLQEREYTPVGADVPKTADIKVITATHQDLEAKVKEGQFRQDLYFRLRTHQLHIPPLQHRLDDIKPLLDHFLTEAGQELAKSKPSYPSELLDLLRSYHFPGNVRELRSLIFDAMSQHSQKMLSMDHFRNYIQREQQKLKSSVQQATNTTSSEPPYFPTLQEAIETHINAALARANGNQRIAANLLGISRQALNKRLQKM